MLERARAQSHVQKRKKHAEVLLHSALGVLPFVMLRAFCKQLCRLTFTLLPFYPSCWGSVFQSLCSKYFPCSCDVIFWACICKPQYCCYSRFSWEEIATNARISPFPLIFYPLAIFFDLHWETQWHVCTELNKPICMSICPDHFLLG